MANTDRSSGDKVTPPDDLKRNPGIGSSKGTTMAGADPDELVPQQGATSPRACRAVSPTCSTSRSRA